MFEAGQGVREKMVLIRKRICDRLEVCCKGMPGWEREVAWSKEQIIWML